MFYTSLAALPVLFALTGCRPDTISPADSGEPLQVVATVGMLADVVGEVAGDRAEVTGLMGSGIDPHLYKPTRSDIRALAAADAVFYVGLHLEGRMADTLHRMRRSGRSMIPVGEGLPEGTIRVPTGFEGHPDPHIWMDVSLWREAVENVAEALCELDPAGRDGYRARAAAYVRRLDRLNAYVAGVIKTIPDGQRHLITAHDAFGYFSRAYDIPVRGVRGISTESEAGLADIRRLVDFIVKRDVPAIFIESSVSPRNLQAVLAGARAQGAEIRIGGELYSDAMGPPGTYEGTYIGMMDHNATTITQALGGTAPAGGFQHMPETTNEPITTGEP